MTGRAAARLRRIARAANRDRRSEEHTSELQSPCNLVCRLLLEKKKKTYVILQRLDKQMKLEPRKVHGIHTKRHPERAANSHVPRPSEVRTLLHQAVQDHRCTE